MLQFLTHANKDKTIRFRVKLGKDIRKFMQYKQKGIRDEDNKEDASDKSYESDQSDMAVDTNDK